MPLGRHTWCSGSDGSPTPLSAVSFNQLKSSPANPAYGVLRGCRLAVGCSGSALTGVHALSAYHYRRRAGRVAARTGALLGGA